MDLLIFLGGIGVLAAISEGIKDAKAHGARFAFVVLGFVLAAGLGLFVWWEAVHPLTQGR